MVREIPPGNFGNPIEVPRENVEQKDTKPVDHPDLVARYSLVREEIIPDAKIVYHPGCANDTSPSAAFPDARVIYVDVNHNDMQGLSTAGFEAHEASALEFKPDSPVDVLILLNPSISSEVPASTVRVGGIVICNNYHGNASELRVKDGFMLQGVVVPDKSAKGYKIDSENLNEYWEEVETEEEFKNAPFSWDGVNYALAKRTVQSMRGVDENILENYKSIIGELRQKERAEAEKKYDNREKNFAEMLSQADNFAPDGEVTVRTEADIEKWRTEYYKMLENNIKAVDSQTMFIINGGTVLEATLPKKKGTVDDLYIFRKQNRE